MIRVRKHLGCDYIIIDTDIILYEDGEIVAITPVQVQVRAKDLSEKHYRAIYRHSSIYFDRTLKVNKPQQVEKKGWFSRWFGN